MSDWSGCTRALAAREAAGLRRVLRPRAADDTVLELAGNDYLGLARDPRVTEAAAQAARRWGAGSTGSRLVTGTTELHATLETELAAFAGASSALVFSSGYLANVGVLTALGGPDVTIVSDAGNHASLIDGCRLSGSPVTVVPAPRSGQAGRCARRPADTPHALVVTDAVFSVDGDLAPLAAMHASPGAHERDCSSSTRPTRSASSAPAGSERWPGGRARPASRTSSARSTLSKSLGAQGGAVLGAPAVIDLLVNTARAFIFDTGLAPVVGRRGAGRAADPGRRARRAAAAAPTRAGLADLVRDARRRDRSFRTPPSFPPFVGDPRRAVAAAAACLRCRCPGRLLPAAVGAARAARACG